MSDSMSANQYRAAVAALNATQRRASRALGVGDRTGRDWADNRVEEALQIGPPEPVARILRFLIRRGISLDEFERDSRPFRE